MRSLIWMSRQTFVAVLLLLTGWVASAQTVKGLPDFTELAEKNGPTVVNISTTQRLARRHDPFANLFPFDEDDPRFDLFRRFLPRPPGSGQSPREMESHSLGSGFIISADGYILTNAHVIEDAEEITVRLTDKREFAAKVIGADKRTDVALLKIDASGLPTARLGDPAQIKPGEWVVAIGSPFGFDNSVTAGIVSAKGRALPQENYVPFIQTDVAINPGNSGGPLFNLKGEVVGVNSQIYSRSGGYMGLSFAIPIDMAMDIQSQLRSGGKVNRGRIGVAIQDVSKDLAESLGFSKPTGAVVMSVEKGSPADKADIEPGDVILKFDGKTIQSAGDLPRTVAVAKPGTRVAIHLWHKGKLRDAQVVIGQFADDKKITQSTTKPVERASNRLGLVVSELSQEQKQQLKVSVGLVVDDTSGLKGRGDLRKGDILLAVVSRGNVTELENAEQLNRLLASFEKTGSVTFLVRRGELQTFIIVKAERG